MSIAFLVVVKFQLAIFNHTFTAQHFALDYWQPMPPFGLIDTSVKICIIGLFVASTVLIIFCCFKSGKRIFQKVSSEPGEQSKPTKFIFSIGERLVLQHCLHTLSCIYFVAYRGSNRIENDRLYYKIIGRYTCVFEDHRIHVVNCVYGFFFVCLALLIIWPVLHPGKSLSQLCLESKSTVGNGGDCTGRIGRSGFKCPNMHQVTMNRGIFKLWTESASKLESFRRFSTN